MTLKVSADKFNCSTNGPIQQKRTRLSSSSQRPIIGLENGSAKAANIEQQTTICNNSIKTPLGQEQQQERQSRWHIRLSKAIAMRSALRRAATTNQEQVTTSSRSPSQKQRINSALRKFNMRWRSNSLASIGWSISAICIIVCCLIIANTNCDQLPANAKLRESSLNNNLGDSNNKRSANVDVNDIAAAAAAAKATNNKSPAKSAKHDPLELVREIYLDGTGQLIELLPDEDPDGVAKFRPNGRYGRRSVDMAEPLSAHVEMGKLVYNDDAATLGSVLRNYNDRDLSTIGQSHRQSRQQPRKRQPTKMFHLSASDDSSSSSSSNDDNSPLLARLGLKSAASSSSVSQEPKPSTMNEAGLAFNENELELNKLLKCNYSGVSNLYWCGNEV